MNCSKIFFDLPPKVMKIKTKVNKWGLIKLKNFCTEKKKKKLKVHQKETLRKGFSGGKNLQMKHLAKD